MAVAERIRSLMDIMTDTETLAPPPTRKAIEVDGDGPEGSYQSRMMTVSTISVNRCGDGGGDQAVIDRLAEGEGSVTYLVIWLKILYTFRRIGLR